MLEGREDVGVGRQRDEIGFNHDARSIGPQMAEKVVLMPRAGPAPLDLHAFTALVWTAWWTSSKRRKKEVSGTLIAWASVCSVLREGEVLPFSIFDSIPMDRPVRLDRSAMVMPL